MLTVRKIKDNPRSEFMNSQERANRITELHKDLGFIVSKLEIESPPSQERLELETKFAKLLEELKRLEVEAPDA